MATVTNGTSGSGITLAGVIGTMAPSGTSAPGRAAAAATTSGTFSGTITTGIVLSDPATQNPATIEPGGYVTNNTTVDNGNAVSATNTAVWTLVNAGSIAGIHGSLSDGVFFQGAGLIENTTGGHITGEFGVQVNGVGEVNNFGTIADVGTDSAGIVLSGGGSVSNGSPGSSGALIAGSAIAVIAAYGAATIVNSGTIESAGAGSARGIVLDDGGRITNGLGGLVIGPGNGIYLGSVASGSTTLLNLGTIVSLGTFVSGTVQRGIAAYVASGSIVTNGQSGSTIGLIEGYYIGIRIGMPGTSSSSVGTITNFGTIAAVDQSGTLPFEIGIQVVDARSSVVNFGTITAVGQGAGTPLPAGGQGVGVQLPAGGVVQNGASNDTTALIEGYTHAVGSGYYPATGTVVNFGTLMSTQTDPARKGLGVAVAFHYSGNAVNYGLILGTLNGVWTGESTIAGTGTVMNAGTIAELAGLYSRAVYLHGGGTVINAQSGAGHGLIAAGWDGVVAVHEPGTVLNSGTIVSSATTFGSPGTVRAVGVDLADGGIVTNGISGATAALIQAAGAPVYIGGYNGVVAAGAVGTVTNFGTIAEVGGAGVAASAVALVAGGSVANYGLIAAVGDTGVSFYNTAGTVTNSGTIVSTSATSAGVYLQNGGLITNGTGGLVSAPQAAIALGGSTGAGAILSNFGTLVGNVGISIAASNIAANTIVNDGTITGTGGIAIRLGSGVETIVIDSGSQLNGAIGNLQPGDAIDLPFLTFGRGGTVSLGPDKVLTVVESSGTFTVSLDPSQSFAGDAFQLSADATGGTLITEVGAQSAADDFDGDHRSDILWRHNDGTLALWTMNGATITAAQAVTFQGNTVAVDLSWSVAGVGDFDGSGTADLLWRNADDTLAEWQMNGATITAAQAVTLAGTTVTPGSTWSVAATGDFDGNGMADLLWRQSTDGTLAEWSMNGPTISAAQTVTFAGNAATPGPTWSVVGSGDFDGNGSGDLLWRDGSNNALTEWEMNGSTITAAQAVTFNGSAVTPDSSWTVAGIGDFTGDSNADILWRNSDGAVDLWAMNGSTITATQAVTFNGSPVSVDSSWTFADIGDFDTDGKADVVWRNTAGTLAEWTMNGATITSAATALTFQGTPVTPDATWQLLT